MFAQFLRDFRLERGLSQDEMANGLSDCLPPGEPISKQNICHWELGKYRPARPVTMFYYVRQHAPAESWQRAFAERGEAVLVTAGDGQ